jgi:hypothetical protein
LFVDKFLQRSLRRKFCRPKRGRVHDHADAGARFGERNHPKPTIETAHHSDERGVASGKAVNIFVMREHGKLLQMVVYFFDVE